MLKNAGLNTRQQEGAISDFRLLLNKKLLNKKLLNKKLVNKKLVNKNLAITAWP